MKTKPLLINLLALSLFAAGCGGGGGSGGSDSPPSDNPPAIVEERGIVGARSLTTIAELPDCNAENDGQLFYVEGTGNFYVCNGSVYQPIDLVGPAGRNGSDGVSISWLGSNTTPPANPAVNAAYYNSIDSRSDPEVAINNSGEIVLVWMQYSRPDLNTVSHIYANRYLPVGGWQGPELLELEEGDSSHAYSPDAGIDEAGNALAV